MPMVLPMYKLRQDFEAEGRRLLCLLFLRLRAVSTNSTEPLCLRQHCCVELSLARCGRVKVLTFCGTFALNLCTPAPLATAIGVLSRGVRRLVFDYVAVSGAATLNQSRMNIPSKCRIASIAPNHAMIRLHDADPKPDGIFGKDTPKLPIKSLHSLAFQ